MASVRNIEWLGVEDYLVGEQAAEVRHEYVAGAVYAMVGSTARHNLLALGLAARLHAHLSGSPCKTFISDMKVRSADAFYYPDVVVTCQPVAPNAVYLTEPTLIVEVLSESTEARDRLEKWTAYRALPSLSEYVLIAQDRPAVEVYRRSENGWNQISLGAGETVELASVAFEVSLDELYAGLPAT
ncbi:MAG: Uma2 family endonuclease [Gammaproteobacteria bacterium]|nr:Uma2 family endonuclease [Gammaproteobacteria bacterium]